MDAFLEDWLRELTRRRDAGEQLSDDDMHRFYTLYDQRISEMVAHYRKRHKRMPTWLKLAGGITRGDLIFDGGRY